MSFWNCGHMDYMGECGMCGRGGECRQSQFVLTLTHTHTLHTSFTPSHSHILSAPHGRSKWWCSCHRRDQRQPHHVDEHTHSTVGPLPLQVSRVTSASESCDLCR